MRGIWRISSLVPATGRIARDKDASETIIYRGQDTGITITAGVVTSGKEIVLKRINADTTLPAIILVSPLQDATEVSRAVDITAAFSEAMDAATINAANFLLRQGSSSISGAVTYSGQTATFNPTSDLSSNTTYTATVKASVTDIAGNAMGTDYPWSFTTATTSPPSTYTNSLGMTFRYISPGMFWMGSPDAEVDRNSNETRHQVTLTTGFYMQTTEVTQIQWVDVLGSNPSYFVSCGNNCPVENVSWDDIQSFINVMNQRGEGTYRLPTEAEWEYCARAGTIPFNTGNCLSTDQANYNGNTPYSGCASGIYRQTPIAVGSFATNAWGLYDMHGNVWEWCQDWYGDYPITAVTDPTGPSSGIYREFRGGGWGADAMGCRSAYRYVSLPGDRYGSLGCRLVRTL